MAALMLPDCSCGGQPRLICIGIYTAVRCPECGKQTGQQLAPAEAVRDWNWMLAMELQKKVMRKQ